MKGNGLPDGWRWEALGSLGEWYGGATPSKSNPEYWGGATPWVSPKDMKSLRIADSEDHLSDEALEGTSIRRYPERTVLMVVRSGILAHTFPVAVAETSGTMNQDLKGLYPRPDVDPAYLTYALRRFGQDVLKECSKHGTTVASIATDALSRFEIPLAPLDTQRRIVAKIDEIFSDLDAGVAAVERAKANLARYRAAVLKAAVEGTLTEEWRRENPDVEPSKELLKRILEERQARWEAEQLIKYEAKGKKPPKGWRDHYGAPAGPVLDDLPTLPPTWTWATTGQLAEIQSGIQKQPKRAPKNNAYPYLRVANVLRGRLNLSEIHRFELFPGEIERLRLKEGDLLVVEGNGSRNQIGRSALWRGEIDDCVHQNHIIRLRVLMGSPDYLNAYWNSPGGSQRVMRIAASTSGLYTLSTSKVSSIPVPLPPLAEQEAITATVADALSVAEWAEQSVSDQTERSGTLRQTILRQAFSGELDCA